MQCIRVLYKLTRTRTLLQPLGPLARMTALLGKVKALYTAIDNIHTGGPYADHGRAAGVSGHKRAGVNR